MVKQSKSSRKKFFVKEDNDVYVVYDKFFDDIDSREEALVIAMRTYGEIHITLQQEAESGEPVFIGNMKIVTGLERSLDELERRWPFLLTELRAVPRRINGRSLSLC
jgi:hypothetical protein